MDIYIIKKGFLLKEEKFQGKLGTNKGGPEKECERDWSVNGRETQREREREFYEKAKEGEISGKVSKAKRKRECV